MTGIDTNVLVRYITQDDPAQAEIATAFIERELTEQDPGFVSIIAIAEAAWVLRRSYHFPVGRIAAAIERTLQMTSLIVEREQVVFAAAAALKAGLADFGDALIALIGAEVGCSRTVTFDRKAQRMAGFSPLTH